ncbi:MAG: DUF4097 family beta strand repeat-containing protein [Candidatus Bipolaricaulota bacterium]|nr:DUF4097 family beta strand repeat-containing protein [Candidatus Bipolaricaulota bacterium]MCS7274002.1 DUF4097 family beta strand repeat-containing protein [Candidatus Bipolaricaulota bacterium]MDW8111355.1 DUF4097 family beta strand repeat-containing protein [Candidatus Bipolaricaulota bacterium]MDW8329225.1 DUF4097 family beta strand repeat-containing protein [Candidatus Bipolaricaulota bacterium]
MRSGAIRFGEFLIFLGVLLLGLQYIPWNNFTPSELSDLVIVGGVVLLIGFGVALWSPSRLLDEIVHVVMLIVGALVVSLILAHSGVSVWVNLAGPVRIEKSFSTEGPFTTEISPTVKLLLINGNISLQTWTAENFEAKVTARARGWNPADVERALREVELAPPRVSPTGIEFNQRLLRLGIGSPVEIELDLRLSLPRDRVYTLEIETVNGRIEIGALNATHARVKTTNGKIELRNLIVENASVETFNGEIEGRLSATQAKLSTMNGAIELRVGAVTGEYTLNTFNGRIQLDIPDDPSVGYQIWAQSTLGRVIANRSDLRLSTEERRHLEGTSANFEQASTKISVRASTMNGNIEIR